MPVYLLHGFRWPRPLIRIHIILQNLDDAAAEWLVAPQTTLTMLKNFNQLYPDSMEHLNHLRFVEQYDPNDTTPGAGSQPYAYVADVCEEIKLGVDVDEVRGKGVPNDQWAAMMELRDKLAPEEKVAWYVVVCGDEERWAPPTVGLLQQGGSTSASPQRESESSSMHSSGVNGSQPSPQQEEQPRGLKKLFSRRKSFSRASVASSNPDASRKAAPPVPPVPAAAAHPPTDGEAKQSPPNGMKLQTNNLGPSSGAPSSGSDPKSAQRSLMEAKEYQEVITGPALEDDDLSAPSPAVRQGKDDLPVRQKSTKSIKSAKKRKSWVAPPVAPAPLVQTPVPRPISPDTIRNMSPHMRNGNAFAAEQYRASSPLAVQPLATNYTNYTHEPPQPEVHAQTTDDDRAVSPEGRSSTTAASMVSAMSRQPTNTSSTATPTPVSPLVSRTNSRSVSPIKSSRRGSQSTVETYQPSGSEKQQQQHHQQQPYRPSSEVSRHQYQPHLETIPSQQGVPSLYHPNGSNASIATHVNKKSNRNSVASKKSVQSGMSGAVQGLYGQHEREWRHRQSVLPEELLARGLDDGVFAGLR